MTPYSETDPSWSPDGQKIVFLRYMGKRDGGLAKEYLYEVFSMNVDGSNVVRLTYTPDGAYSQKNNPIWSPH